MLHNEARELLVEAYEKTGKAKEVAECFFSRYKYGVSFESAEESHRFRQA